MKAIVLLGDDQTGKRTIINTLVVEYLMTGLHFFPLSVPGSSSAPLCYSFNIPMVNPFTPSDLLLLLCGWNKHGENVKIVVNTKGDSELDLNELQKFDRDCYINYGRYDFLITALHSNMEALFDSPSIGFCEEPIIKKIRVGKVNVYPDYDNIMRYIRGIYNDVREIMDRDMYF